MRLFYFASFVTLVSCTGYLEIRLKSEYPQPLTLLLAEGSTPAYIALPTRLAGQEEKVLGKFPIDFQQQYTLSLLGGKIEKLGINGSSYRADFKPLRGSVSPKQLHLPLSGLQLVIECEKGWSGDKCDIECDESSFSKKKCSVELIEQDLIVSTDYTIDMEQLPTIIGRLKETTKVRNELRRREERTERKQEEIKEQKTETVEWRKRGDKKQPALVSTLYELFNQFVPKGSPPSKEKKSPWHVSMSVSDRSTGEETFSRSFSPMDMLMAPKKEESKTDMIGDIMGSFMPPSNPMMSMLGPMALMGMMPRMPRHVEAQDDFTADQIIKKN